jgi:pyruvate kinase
VLEDAGADEPIVAKIERAGAVENLEEIADAAYGVMVARGDPGVECPMEDVPIVQKRIIRAARSAGIPVITATEMLDSMVHARRPTRAEASDVANAVLDGTDAVMLSGETAVGDHPVRVVETMARIVADVEDSDEYDEALERHVPAAGDSRTDALARSARYLARDVGASAIVAASESGYTARKAAKYRPGIPIVAATPNERVHRQLALSWGITPVAAEYGGGSADAVIQRGVQAALESGAAESGDTVVVLAGMMTQYEGLDTTNMLKVHVASETLAAGQSVVSGYATGPLIRVGDGNLAGAPDGAILAVPSEFDGEFSGDLSGLAGIVDGHEGRTGYAAIVARELGVPMICGASVPHGVAEGRVVTLDGERGVLYGDPLQGSDGGDGHGG